MSFFNEIEAIIRSAYFEIVRRQVVSSNQGKELNCGSYAYITKEIRLILIECNRQGLNVLDTTNHLICDLLKRNYFVYNNHIMSAFIGYQYLKRMAEVKRQFSIDGITDNSTINDISKHTITW